MAGNYVYILSALPVLHFGHKAPLSYEAFLSSCRTLVDEKEMILLEQLLSWDRVSPIEGSPELLEPWRLFEVGLRNELATLRSARLQKDAAPYIRPEGLWDPQMIHAAANALRQPILDAARMLDEERWKKMEELSLGHYFDMDVLLFYALKLLILIRWDKVRSADKERVLEEVLPVPSA